MRNALIILALTVATAMALEQQVVTMKDGKKYTGAYSEPGRSITVNVGKGTAEIPIDPRDVARVETVTIPDAPPAVVAPATEPKKGRRFVDVVIDADRLRAKARALDAQAKAMEDDYLIEWARRADFSPFPNQRLADPKLSEQQRFSQIEDMNHRMENIIPLLKKKDASAQLAEFIRDLMRCGGFEGVYAVERGEP